MIATMQVKRRGSPAVIVVALIAMLVVPASSVIRTGPAASGLALAAPDLGRLPLSFEPNVGQSDASVRFMARVPGGKLFFMPQGVGIGLNGLTSERGEAKAAPTFVRMNFEGANPSALVVAGGALPGKVNYLLGNDSSKWHTDLPTYGDISYKSLYPGIDLAYSGSTGQLKGTYTVAAGVDPSLISWRYSGASLPTVDAAGNLNISLQGAGQSKIVERAPVAWQEIGGRRVSVASAYSIGADRTVGFALATYDSSYPLIIDPPLELPYSTYLGGGNNDFGRGVAVDASGNAYVVGDTLSTNFPTRNQYQLDVLGRDVFVAKINTNAAGDPSLVYSTYLGGGAGSPADDYGYAIAVASGQAFVTGYTQSSDFPTLNQYQTDQAFTDTFVTRLSAGGSSLVYSTYLGGGSSEYGYGIAADAAGNAFIAGQTFSTNFPTRNQYQLDQSGQDGFVTRLNTNASGDPSLVYSTYLGGADIDAGYGIATDGLLNAFIGGQTLSTDFPVLNQYQTNQPVSDAFVTRINTSLSGGASLIYSTYLGGNDLDTANAIAVDTSGNAYVTGQSDSNDYPLRNQYQGNLDPATDAFLTKINTLAAGDASLVYSTLICGNSADIGKGIAVLGANAYVVGQTGSNNFPLRNQYQGDAAGYDAFVIKINTLLSGDSSMIYSTYLGGSSDDFGYAIAVDPSGNAYVTGETASTNFPVSNQYQTDQASTDAFVAKLVEPAVATPTGTTVAPTATRTNTAMPATNTPTRTNTAVPPTSTAPHTATATNTNMPPSSTPLPPTNTATRTNTSVPPTATRTNTAVPPTNTSTRTSTVAPTQTQGGATATLVPPSSTPLPPTVTRTTTRTATRTATAEPPSMTPTRTNTSAPATATRTSTPVPPSMTPTRTNTVAPTQTVGGATATLVPTSTRTPIPPTSTKTPTHTKTPVSPSSTMPPMGTATATKTSEVTVTATACLISFSDVPADSPFYSFIRCLACRGIVNGYSDGTFRPGNNITRGQLSKIVSNAAGFEGRLPGQTFEDVPSDSTFYLYIERMSSRGIIGGYPCGGVGEPCVGPDNRPYFRPNANATRGQISKIVSNAAGYSDDPVGQLFEDVPPSNSFYVWVQRLASRGIMGGYLCGGAGEPCNPPENRPYFRPNNLATRGQVSKIVANTFFPNCQTP